MRLPFAICIWALVLLSLSQTHLLAWSPRVNRVEPKGLQRGTRCEISIAGERLAEATDLLIDGGGIQVESVTAAGGDELTVVLQLQKACLLGEHRFWVVGPRGLSEMATVRVGPFPIATEVEPNNNLNEPQQIIRGDGVTIRGVIEEADVDCFSVVLARGERVSLDLEAMRLGSAFFDAYLDVVAPDGSIVASADDDPVSLQDPRLSYVAQVDGRHVIRVREAAFGGDFESQYLLHIGDFPVVHTALPAGGPAGRLSAQLLGDHRGPIPAELELPGTSNPSCWQHRPTESDSATSPTAIPLRICELRNVVEGTSPAEIDAGRPPVAVNGVLRQPYEVDHFTFQADAGEVLQVEAFAARIGSPIDSVLAIEGPTGPLVENDDDGAVHDSLARFQVEQTGRHELAIRDHLGRGGPSHTYRIEITRIEPSLTLTTPILDPLRPQESQRIHVPQGGRTAVLVAARRDRFDGPIEMMFADLPIGVRATVDPIPPGEHLAVALLEADANAPLGASLCEVASYGNASTGTVVGKLSHNIGLVFGEPRRTVYYGSKIERTPIAVTQPPPFTIDIQRPLSPLARDGRKDLVVRVTREPDFEEPITITSPRLPEWVERSEDPVQIESGESEVTFPLIATDRATPGEHALLLVGSARVDGAEVSNASAPVPIRLVAPHAELRIDHTTVEQGAEAMVRCHFDWIVQHPTAATALLRGLPKHAAAPQVALEPGQSEIVFPVQVGDATPAALHNTLFVELAVGDPSEPVRQYLGRGGVLEVVPPGGTARRKVSRLEELRREAAQIHREVTSQR